MDLKKARDFVRDTALPAPPPRPAGTVHKMEVSTATEAQAAVTGPQVVTFDETISPALRQAVLDATLFAALAANAKAPVRGSPEWLGAYRQTIVPLGWSPAGDSKQVAFESHRRGQVHEAIIEFLGTLALSPPAIALVQAALKALKSVGDDQPWITLFERQTKAQKLTGFNIATVTGSDVSLRTQLSQFALKGSAELTQVLFLIFQDDKVSLQASNESYDINVGRLLELQPDLAQRLRDYASQLIAEVPLQG